MLTELLDVEGVAGGPIERRGYSIRLEGHPVRLRALYERGFGVLL
jgi:hypothetical protein